MKTHCPYCAFQCGIRVTPAASNDGAPFEAKLEVRADEEFPVNRGQMCIKGFTSAALLDHEARVLTPLVRGRDGRLVTATWDAALDFVAERLQAIRATHGAAALGMFGSGALTNEKTYLLGKFARVALGTPNIDYNGRYCMSSAAAGQNRAFGVDRGLPFPVEDIGQTDVLVLWGANPADTMPPMMQWVNAVRERGGKVVVVDPRRTETARVADLHLQPTPGTDLALANGLLALAIEEGLVDEPYVAARTVGWDALRRHLLMTDPAHVERATGVSLDRQRELVRMFAAAPRAMVLSGRGPEQQSKGADTVSALVNLALALGKVGKPYSGYGCITGQGNGQGGREHGQKADQLPGYRMIENAADRAHVARVWGVDPASLPGKGKSAYELLDALGAGGIRALLVFGSNVAVASPNALNIERRLAALDLLVVADAFLNETSAHAHVVLPVAQFGEETGTLTNLEGRVILRERLRPTPAGARSDLEILCALAARLGAGALFPTSDPEAVFAELGAATAGARADYSGISYDKIRRQKGVFWPCPSDNHAGTPRLFADRFFHADGKARFVVARDRASAEVPDAEYPLYFTTGRTREHYNSGAQTRQVKPLVDAQPEPRVQIHPRLAASLGADEDGRLVVESRRGAVTFALSLTTDIRPDTLFAPFHWGGKQAANILTVPALDPTSRMPEFKVCAVRARAVAEAAA
ncbi:MAG TPA: molybdopterin oxidoreductase family protein [Polyangia bacterium]|nr:molybdopterin oxidoreductase family protein [Polyangia bacterium]